MMCPYPMHSESVGLVSEALRAAQKLVGPLGKHGRGFNNQAFVTFEQLQNAIFEALEQNGLTATQIMLPFPGEIQQLQKSEIKKDVRGEDTTHRQFITPVCVAGLFRTTILHDSGEWLASDWPILADWSDPKAVGIVVGHFKRYALECLMQIIKVADEPAPRQGKGSAPRSRGSRESTPPAADVRMSTPHKPDVVPPWSGKDEVRDSLYDDPAEDPGGSGEALFSWLYDRSGCNEPRVAAALLPYARGQGYPENIRDWTPAQAGLMFGYAKKKLARIREADAAAAAAAPAAQAAAEKPKPPRNGFKELAGVNANISTTFDEFHNNGGA